MLLFFHSLIWTSRQTSSLMHLVLLEPLSQKFKVLIQVVTLTVGHRCTDRATLVICHIETDVLQELNELNIWCKGTHSRALAQRTRMRWPARSSVICSLWSSTSYWSNLLALIVSLMISKAVASLITRWWPVYSIIVWSTSIWELIWLDPFPALVQLRGWPWTQGQLPWRERGLLSFLLFDNHSWTPIGLGSNGSASLRLIGCGLLHQVV